jgi:helicase
MLFEVDGHFVMALSHSGLAFRGKIEHGDIRRFADSTRFHLRSASEILSILLVERYSQEGINTVLSQLEVGIPAEALGLLKLPVVFTRGEYLALFAAGMGTVEQFWTASPDILKGILGELRSIQVEKLRPK